ncbi:MAG: rhamnose ABC transporter substrate-binding protein [Spirochaetes bacterium]|nr:MAG: rhamnose ABC transporter substrate-binding protein [Spirochaetota bacterium]
MKYKNKVLLLFVVFLFAGTLVFAAGQKEKAPEKGKVKIAMVVKNLGNAFFEACHDGGKEATKELGGFELIFQGPSTPTAEGQIEIIDSLIAQKVDGIAISANDKDALVPICKKAMSKGIKVISFDSGIAPEGRILHLAPSSDEYIGRSEVQLLAEMIGYKGEIAILSASSTATNQNAWIEWMKKELEKPEYKNMKLVAVVYGDDLSDKSYREAMGLFKSYPNLRGIISPTTVGIAATAKALEDAGLAGKIALTGLGLPSEMKQYIKDGTCEKMELWNPIDLGYSATYITYKLVTGEFTGKPGEVMHVGRMGDIKVGENGVAVMGKPYVFDKSNIDKFAAIY